MKTEIKAVIFDLDGTLLDTAQDLCDAVNYALGNENMPLITAEQCVSYVGNGVRNLVQLASGVSETEKLDKMVAEFRAYYREHMEDKTCPYDKVLEMLAVLDGNGIKTAVLSNKYDEATKRLCKKLLPDTFVCVYGEGGEIPRKPDPAGVLKILGQIGVKPEQAAYVGDSGSDMVTAINSGTHPIGVSWGFRSAESLKEAGAAFIADTPLEISEYVLKK